MKRFLFLIATLSIIPMHSQDLRDAYRYANTELSGTARFMGMSGAFGALGGDISAISMNPASSAVFLSSSSTITMGYSDLDNSINFNDNNGSSSETNFDLGNIGGVFVFNAKSNNNWRKFSLGVNYTTESNYEENYNIRGFSSNSIDQYFLSYANGIPLDLIDLRENESRSELYSFLGENYGYDAQQAFLGYEGNIIAAEVEDPNNTEYSSLISPGSFDQRYRYAANGLNGKLTFNLGTQYKDFIYLGLNLNSHFINYENSTSFTEFNSNSGSEITEVQFGNNLVTNGEGFSFQLGGIAKVSDNIRFGLTYDSPTWFIMREETTQYLDTNSSLDEFISISPQVINVYPEYRYKTPGKLNGSFAYLFGKRGLISLDYGWKDYTNIEYSSNYNISYADLNNAINDEMKAAGSLRIGGEYRISNFSLRAGYRMEDSPFEENGLVGDLTSYSGGIGYGFGSFNIDLAYNYTNIENDSSTGFINPVSIDRDLSKVILSLTFGL
ncbi:OmpP1/FadL family transporter [Christiangramia echinicola]|uniref:Outer membrane protein transport protein (OMPP1/FadL/TodX) n=1 Tax=Christiangramia echinicola TaxID=279359 RepID=A0A1H1PES4_9FLAO|nr:outer membrane protein transport protein [Christiangramia echinicola]SDS09139.1 Outer membrane protein transport protein (OMPP1/FadL/TodX) [Christiangramia echinicola]